MKFFKNLFSSPQAKKIAENATIFARENFEKAKENATPYLEKAEDYLETAKEKTAPYLEKAEVVAGETKEKVLEVLENLKDKVTDFVDEAHQKKEQTIDFIEIDDEATENQKTTKTREEN
ncbi:YtxH domain-containing protein [Flavobacterium sp.]|uniref:YtxH domain-containing protein n=1 Tax=Flavobacterium sp. TaxID=239 RepID=UPI00261FF6D0|nr:YtxH domain-containing protein [Flavobacterium sp.]MDD3004272.1 YtxH domain-containing protein [Flavobacterium sp.]